MGGCSSKTQQSDIGGRVESTERGEVDQTAAGGRLHESELGDQGKSDGTGELVPRAKGDEPPAEGKKQPDSVQQVQEKLLDGTKEPNALENQQQDMPVMPQKLSKERLELQLGQRQEQSANDASPEKPPEEIQQEVPKEPDQRAPEEPKAVDSGTPMDVGQQADRDCQNDEESTFPSTGEEVMKPNWGAKSRAEAELHLGTQAHLALFWDELSEPERIALMAQFDSIDLADAKRAFDLSALPEPGDGREGGVYRDMERLQGIDDEHYAVRKNLNEEMLANYWHRGLEAIADGKVGVIVLAGGQATRLGAVHPKGTLSLGLEGFSGTDSLLSIQGARIARLQRLAASAFPDSKPVIQWLVMTSKATERDTVEHLKEIVPECGLDENQVVIFSQNDFPCFDMDGNLILATKSSIAMAPDGNGGLYTALAPYLGRMRARGVQYLHVYCVDNVLCRVADPYFIGFCIEKEADCAAKVVEKVDPHEAVGVICRESGKVKVVEYSEITKEIAERRDERGRLVLRAGNIANHFFTIEFLEHVCKAENRLNFHRAIKKIPCVGDDGQIVKPEKPNGVKLEQFVFDVFEYSNNFYVWEVCREEEFSPLKNAESVGKDCMSTCRRDLSRENRRWLQCIGASVEGEGHVFIHPFRSYAGEGLEEYSDSHISTPTAIN